MKGTHDNGRHRAPRLGQHGYTLTELLVVIGVIGVLAAIAIPQLGGIFKPSKETLARNTLETVNNAVHRFNQTNYELLLTAIASGQDEMQVLRTLQYRSPSNPMPGSPYMRLDWSPETSGNSEDYRLMWMGNLYKLLLPGESGTGIKVQFDAADLGKPYVFPADFTMAGK